MPEYFRVSAIIMYVHTLVHKNMINTKLLHQNKVIIIEKETLYFFLVNTYVAYTKITYVILRLIYVILRFTM